MPLTDLSDPDVLLRENWNASLHRDADGTPTLPPAFVAEAGPRVWIIDVRGDEELTGATGHIPGTWRMPLRHVGEIAERLPATTPVVVVCDDGTRSSTVARYMVALGMTTVAAMDGGMIRWRNAGYGVSRDPAVRARELKRPSPGCGSDEQLLVRGRKTKKLDQQAITDHLGDPAKVRRVKLAALLTANQTSCVDGREDRAIIGTPGGDAGELVLGLAAVEQVAGNAVELSKVATLMRGFADTFGGIYLHTDNHALNHLTRAVRGDKRLEGFVATLSTISDWEDFVRRPPHGARDALLEHLIEPAHVGCGHLRLALTQPTAYQLRPEIVTAVLREFYLGLWAGAPDLEWVVLGGDHGEGAVANVTMEGELWPFSMVPMVAPAVGGVQMFVNHPQVVAYLRRQTARFFGYSANNLLPVGKVHEDALTQAIPEMGGVQATATLVALAAGLPVFNLRVPRSGPIEVSEGDPIPG